MAKDAKKDPKIVTDDQKKEISDNELDNATGGATPVGQGKAKPRF